MFKYFWGSFPYFLEPFNVFLCPIPAEIQKINVGGISTFSSCVIQSVILIIGWMCEVFAQVKCSTA